MIDAYTIGITLALDNGVSAGVATIRRDLQELDRAMRASTLGLAQLQRAAAVVLGTGVATQAAAAQVAARPSPNPVVPPTADAGPEGEDGLPVAPPPTFSAEPVIVTISAPAGVAEVATPAAPAALPALPPPASAVPPAPTAPAAVAPPVGVAAPLVTPPVAPAPVAPTVAVPTPPPAPRAPQMAPPPAAIAPPTVSFLAPPPPIMREPPPPPVPAPTPPIVQSMPGSREAVPAAAPRRPPMPREVVDLAAFGRALLPPPATEALDPILVPRQSLADQPKIAARQPHPEVPQPELSRRRSARDNDLADVRHTARQLRPVVAPPPPNMPMQPGPAAPSAGAMPLPVAGATAPAAPAAQASGARGAANGDVFLDGARVGRWMSDQIGRSASRPPSGPTGFDPRQSPAWAGATVSP